MLKNKKLGEIVRFVLTGGICFLVEFILLVLLRDMAGFPTLLANAIGFTVSVIVNYFLCLLWVFQGASKGGSGRQAAFFLTSVIGLGLNELIMFLLGIFLGEKYHSFSVDHPHTRGRIGYPLSGQELYEHIKVFYPYPS